MVDDFTIDHHGVAQQQHHIFKILFAGVYILYGMLDHFAMVDVITTQLFRAIDDLRAIFYSGFGNGLTIVQSMQLTHQAIENPHLQREFEAVQRHVGEGVSLSRALDRSGQFPPLLLDMVNVGEQTGDMPAALSRAAERFDRELSKKIDTLAACIQPLIVFIMAGMVGFMAYIMMSTIFETISSIK